MKHASVLWRGPGSKTSALIRVQCILSFCVGSAAAAPLEVELEPLKDDAVLAVSIRNKGAEETIVLRRVAECLVDVGFGYFDTSLPRLSPTSPGGLVSDGKTFSGKWPIIAVVLNDKPLEGETVTLKEGSKLTVVLDLAALVRRVEYREVFSKAPFVGEKFRRLTVSISVHLSDPAIEDRQGGKQRLRCVSGIYHFPKIEDFFTFSHVDAIRVPMR